MKRKTSLLLSIALILATGTLADATIINDTGSDAYYGARAYGLTGVLPSTSDVIGNPAIFDVTSMEVTYTGHSLSARINSGYFQYWHDNGAYQPGDLFLSTDGWTPDSGSAATNYDHDYMGNGTSWEYVVHLTGLQPGSDAGSTELYSIGEGSIGYGSERTIQEVTFDPDSTATPSATGTWSLVGGDGSAAAPYTAMLISLTLPDVFAGFDRLGLHWGMTCGNDIVEGEVTAAPVPEPATMLLFGTGLMGLTAVARRKIKEG